MVVVGSGAGGAVVATLARRGRPPRDRARGGPVLPRRRVPAVEAERVGAPPLPRGGDAHGASASAQTPIISHHARPRGGRIARAHRRRLLPHPGRGPPPLGARPRPRRALGARPRGRLRGRRAPPRRARGARLDALRVDRPLRRGRRAARHRDEARSAATPATTARATRAATSPAPPAPSDRSTSPTCPRRSTHGARVVSDALVRARDRRARPRRRRRGPAPRRRRAARPRTASACARRWSSPRAAPCTPRSCSSPRASRDRAGVLGQQHHAAPGGARGRALRRAASTAGTARCRASTPITSRPRASSSWASTRPVNVLAAGLPGVGPALRRRVRELPYSRRLRRDDPRRGRRPVRPGPGREPILTYAHGAARSRRGSAARSRSSPRSPSPPARARCSRRSSASRPSPRWTRPARWSTRATTRAASSAWPSTRSAARAPPTIRGAAWSTRAARASSCPGSSSPTARSCRPASG